MRWFLLPLLVGCSDYELTPKNDEPNLGADDPDQLPDDGSLGGTGGGDDTGGSAVEDCNGVDDDGDGEVDEGFPDLDGDGIKDCLDDDCPLDEPVAGAVTVDPACGTADVEVSDPWSVSIEWQWTGLASDPTVKSSYVTPVVAPMRDTDGDGDIDTRDVPDIAFVTVGGWLVVVAGDTGVERWAVDGMEGQAGVAVADLDEDGAADVLTVDEDGFPVLFDADGAELWRAPRSVAAGYPQPAVADLDADGRPEALVDNLVLDGVTGVVESDFPPMSGQPYRMAVAGDLDLDGSQEVIFGDTVYDAAGTPLWSGNVTGDYGLWAAPIDADGDPEAEVMVFGGGDLAVFEHDGTPVLRTSDASWDRPGPPCVADFDGDGAVEVAFASYDVFSVLELDGSLVWERTIDDSSGLAGCAGFDFDADGAYEVVYADQRRLFIFDGADGSRRFRQSNHESVTAFEYPVVADVDADGSAEIVFVSNYWDEGWGGLTVLGHDGDGWPPSGSSWPVHDFAVTNVSSLGRIPRSPYPPWRIYNVMRARPSADGAATDLGVEIVDVCASSCDPEVGIARVAVQVWNEGSLASPASLPLSLYVDTGSSSVLLGQQAIPPLESGASSDALLFEVPVTELAAGTLFVLADDDLEGGPGLLVECDETDNRHDWVAWDPCADAE